MARIPYETKKFKPETLNVIAHAVQICQEYAALGFDLTLRQLYYQFVSRDLIPNRQTEYKRLGSIVNDARMAGLLDWDYIVDRTRGIEHRSHFGSPSDIVDAAARQYARDLWTEQKLRIEVWIEKDALTGVIEPTCRQNDLTYFSCRGYTSQSEMHDAATRLGRYIDAGQRVVILHLGDHDPSGLDMTRDIRERLEGFMFADFYNSCTPGTCGAQFSEIERAMAEHVGIDFDAGERPFEVRRIALTMDQIDEYEPPPNPAKATDARFANYEAMYGDESWELDALEPTVLAALIDDAVEELRDPDVWDEACERERSERASVATAATRWAEVVEFLEAADEAS